ncbi:MAG TPA: RlmE family RNA methyltransferase [Thermopetrobacter sp.]|nr:RlmE family RNA methyltransferase [Thermopetrobacter sp.]
MSGPRRPEGAGRRRNPPGRGRRRLKVKVKKARGKTTSQVRWLQRQLNDPFVAEAKRLGYRSRAAFKLIGIDDEFGLLKPGARVIDLGATPGGWSQVAAERVGAAQGAGRVVAVDLHGIEPIPGVVILKKDFYDADAPEMIMKALGDAQADVVLSDMAAHATGHKQTDHLRVMGLAEVAADFARKVLAPGGAFVAKVLRGGTENALLNELKRDFAKVRHFKPQASRADSAELYVVATGFRGKSGE